MAGVAVMRCLMMMMTVMMVIMMMVIMMFVIITVMTASNLGQLILIQILQNNFLSYGLLCERKHGCLLRYKTNHFR